MWGLSHEQLATVPSPEFRDVLAAYGRSSWLAEGELRGVTMPHPDNLGLTDRALSELSRCGYPGDSAITPIVKVLSKRPSLLSDPLLLSELVMRIIPPGSWSDEITKIYSRELAAVQYVHRTAWPLAVTWAKHSPRSFEMACQAVELTATSDSDVVDDLLQVYVGSATLTRTHKHSRLLDHSHGLLEWTVLDRAAPLVGDLGTLDSLVSASTGSSPIERFNFLANEVTKTGAPAEWVIAANPPELEGVGLWENDSWGTPAPTSTQGTPVELIPRPWSKIDQFIRGVPVTPIVSPGKLKPR